MSGAPSPTTAPAARVVLFVRIEGYLVPTTWACASHSSPRNGIRRRTDERVHSNSWPRPRVCVGGAAGRIRLTSGEPACAIEREGRPNVHFVASEERPSSARLPSAIRQSPQSGIRHATMACRRVRSRRALHAPSGGGAASTANTAGAPAYRIECAVRRVVRAARGAAFSSARSSVARF